MLRIETKERTNARTVLSVSGDLRAADMAEVSDLIRSAQTSSDEVQIDCRNVRLLDREAIRCLAACPKVQLVHAPAYIREWLRMERRIAK
jgi:ABC-type transporter Mla MlaB component